MAYADLAELRSYVGISDPTDTASDDLLQLALDAASEQIDAYTRRTFEADAEPTPRLYEPEHPWYVNIDPVTTTTGLVVATDDDGDGDFETTWVEGTDYRLEPLNAAVDGDAWTRLAALGPRTFPRHARRPGLRVVAVFGWPGAIPDAVHQACLQQAHRLFERRVSPFGVAGSPDLGSEVRLLARLDPDVEALLRPLRRNWWVV